ncbi:hypothetical protein MNAN1_002932 [Malassezia nana]|uniref:Aromatic-L-amino-acid decarboxylase n=1 Tax=Malassezia nana TaxID=180528 RepID=A0AAF0J3H5_9BASI|nr:hypothetical protein MNAN1_002932 [Malassezia nana]
MDRDAFRAAAHATVDRICDYYETLEARPVTAQVERGYLAPRLPSEAPDQGEPWSAIIGDYDKHILPGMTHWQHPMFFGFFPANATYEGILADMLACMTNNPAFNWNASPAVTELEFVVLDWVAKMLGLSSDFLSLDTSHNGGGIIFGSASEATLTLAVAARERAIERLATARGVTPDTMRSEVLPRLVLYCTEQTHSSARKAAQILGLTCRVLPVYRHDAYALRGATLRDALARDQEAGLVPFYLVATYGTTNTCAIDALAELADARRDAPLLWLHVDAAYGGVALSVPEYRDAHLAAINAHVDSFSTNLHKWGLVPFESSPTFVRDRAPLVQALTLTPAYLASKGGEDLVSDLRNMQISLGRRFRALKVWMVLRSYGVHGFQQHIRDHVALAEAFVARIKSYPQIEVPIAPRWGLVVLRVSRPGLDEAQTEALNQAWVQALGAHSANLLLTPTVVPGIGTCVRWVVGSVVTRIEHIERAAALMGACAEALP